jgi:FAD/FMN-containing dehydrogenase
MPVPSPALADALDRLEALLPQLIADHPDEADFWPAFAGFADLIEDSASAQDFYAVHDRIDRMLRQARVTFVVEEDTAFA